MDYRQLQWAIAHDPCKERDRTPAGAVPMGTSVTISLRVEAMARAYIKHVQLLFGFASVDDPARLDWLEPDMHSTEYGWSMSFSTADFPHVAFYAFALTLTDGESAYYIPRTDNRSTAGELVIAGNGGAWTERGWVPVEPAQDDGDEDNVGTFDLAEPTPGFQITVYDPSFQTPDWLAGAVMYQIFPDRFAQGEDGVNTSGLAYHERMKRPVHLHEDWNEPVEWEDPADGHYDPVDFYGGTLAGIREKLPYLASLGVEVLYLNPIFEARSNHRYDTADYEHIDPLLGTNEDFVGLCDAARELGISVVLDAVLSHTGADSRYFNAKESYDEPGALHDPSSPYRSWYDFDNPSGDAPYRCWWGFPSLPEVDEQNESWQRYMLDDVASRNQDGENHVQEDAAQTNGASHAQDGAVITGDDVRTTSEPTSTKPGRSPSCMTKPAPGQGILPFWLAAGARGYRLDVADELPDEVLELIRISAKSANPDAAIIGEVWEDPTNKVSYGTRRTYALGRALDSVMNYPLRNALLGFATDTVDALQLATFLKLQQANYPAPMYRCLMNLLSSHDVERLRTVLALGDGCKHLPRDEQLAVTSSITPEQDARAAHLQRLIVGILYALPGTPCVYYGDERGLQGGGDPFCRATFPWEDSADRPDRGVDLTDFYREMGTLRKNSRILKNGDMRCCSLGTDAIVIVRTMAGEAPLIAIANRADTALTGAFDLRGLHIGDVIERRELALLHGAGSADIEHGIVRFSIGPLFVAYFR